MRTVDHTRSADGTTIPIRLVRDRDPSRDLERVHIIATWAGDSPYITVCAKAVAIETASTWTGDKSDATCDPCRRWTTR